MGSMLGTIVKALCAQNDREQSRSPRPSIFHQSAVTDQNQVIPQPHLEGHFVTNRVTLKCILRSCGYIFRGGVFKVGH